MAFQKQLLNVIANLEAIAHCLRIQLNAVIPIIDRPLRMKMRIAYCVVLASQLQLYYTSLRSADSVFPECRANSNEQADGHNSTLISCDTLIISHCRDIISSDVGLLPPEENEVYSIPSWRAFADNAIPHSTSDSSSFRYSSRQAQKRSLTVLGHSFHKDDM